MIRFGERLKELRSEKNISREELANKLNVSVRLISYYECGKRQCSFETLVFLAEYFDVSTDYLLGYKDY